MAAENDMQAHRATYGKVMGVLKYGAIVCFVIAAAVIFVITRK